MITLKQPPSLINLSPLGRAKGQSLKKLGQRAKYASVKEVSGGFF